MSPIVGATLVTFGCRVGDVQVVKTWQKHQDANEQDRSGWAAPFEMQGNLGSRTKFIWEGRSRSDLFEN